jgi:dTDP-L-rhamnose 4-epimerase
MNILITGGAGFIGSHTADLLLNQGHKVRILDSLDDQIHGKDAQFPSYLSPNVEKIQGDIRDFKTVTDALENIDAVIHLAALTGVGQSMYELQRYTDVNITGTATLLEAIIRTKRPLKRFVLGSSRAVYGEGSLYCEEHGTVQPPSRSREQLDQGLFEYTCPSCNAILKDAPTSEEHPVQPLSIYAWTKAQQEELVRYSAKIFNLPAIILRYFNVYGARQSLQNPYTGIIAIFYARIQAGCPISIYEQDYPLRDMIAIADVAKANTHALTSPIPSDFAINIGTGLKYKISDIATTLMDVMNKKVPIEITNQYRIGDILQCYADYRKKECFFGDHTYLSLRQGLKDFVLWANTQQSQDLYQKMVDELKTFDLYKSNN